MSGYSRRGREAERGPASVTRRSVWLHKVYPLSARLVPDRPAFGPLAQMAEHRHHTPRVAGSSPARSTGANLNQVGIVRSGCFPTAGGRTISIMVAGSAPETLNARGRGVRRCSGLVSGNADPGEARTKRACQSAVRLGAGLGNEAIQPSVS